ncbi:MAG TPA: putative sulfate exporter family transporter, partial [Myxococcota bacterium]
MNQPRGDWSDLYKKEDWWAIWLALGLVFAALLFFSAGSSIGPIAVEPPKWDSPSRVGSHFADAWPWYLAQLAMWLSIFGVSMKVMGHKVGEFVPGFLILFALSVAILVFSSWKYAKDYNLEAPLVALLLGLVAGNTLKMPRWIDTSLRTEYYIKTGIILLGATLPFTLILKAGPIAFVQATVVSLSTFFTIYWVGTRMFGLDRRFASVMGAGGSVCGVSASIAVGGAVRAEKEHVAISISLVTLWAIVMIFVLPIASKALGLDAGVAGAWIGTSEFADAAGFAAAQAMGDEKAIRAFTLMKVIGRDIWIGLWSFALAIVSVVYWEKREGSGPEDRLSAMEIWWRFPKFVLGFFIASVVISMVSIGYSGERFDDVLKPQLIEPIKTLRTWTFIFTFLCIGLTTRFRELARFGWHPLAAFTAGVVVNVPLGYVLSSVLFA